MRRRALSTALSVALFAFAACSSDGSDDGAMQPCVDITTPDTVGVDTDEDTGEPAPVEYPDEAYSADEEAFLEAYFVVVNQASSLDLDTFLALYPEPDYTEDLGYLPSESAFYDGITSAYGMTTDETALLEANGFVVTEGNDFASFGEAYLDIFYRDLPVFVSADSVLHAVHRSFDTILKDIETYHLYDLLETLLAGAHATLVDAAAPFGADVPDYLDDVDVYYVVARSLLSGGEVEPVLDAANGAAAAEILSAIPSGGLATIELFGTDRVVDFSQFQPRGHYTESELLGRYFKAMIWLGRTDLRITEFDITSKTWHFDERQLMVSYYLYATVEASGGMALWEEIDAIIALMVGDADDLNMPMLEGFLDAVGVEEGADLLEPSTQEAFLAALDQSPQGVQKICSQIILSNPGDPDTTPLPRTFLFMGQRFTVDSYVFSNVVFDRIVVDDFKIERMLPDPLDAWFVMGNPRAVAHLQDDLAVYPYQGNLHTLRFLVDQYDESFWQKNMYNLWLTALKGLHGPHVDTGAPTTMQTAAYHDKLTMTQLASWSQLRHDTILYVKQSYTAYPTCEYPTGYVEPVPATYDALQTYGTEAAELFAGTTLPSYTKSDVVQHFQGFAETMATLEAIADKELVGDPLAANEEEFIADTIVKVEEDIGCAMITTYAGWYPELFYDGVEDSVNADYVVADIHTNPADQQVLHVGTGKVRTMIFTAQTCDGPTAYVGPVFSYYEQVEGDMHRLDDDEWTTMVNGGELTAPSWTSSFAAID